MNTTLRFLSYAVAAADCGNVTEAARMLNVSQPSVSAAIAQIEAEFGVQLFVRHHARGISPTAAGRRIIAEARILLNHARDFAQSAQAMGSEIRGDVEVGVFPTLAARYMPAILGALAASRPGITVTLHEGDQDELIAGILTGRTEIALSYDFAIPAEIIAEPMASLPPKVICPPGWEMAEAPEIALEDLVEKRLLLLDLPHSREYFLSLFARCGIQPRVAYRSRSYELIRGMVGQGLGYTIHNATPVSPYTYDGAKVAIVPLAGQHEPVRIMALSARRGLMRPVVTAFLAQLRTHFAAPPDTGPA